MMMQVPAVPPVVNIQVARTCNLRCAFCSHDVWAQPTGLMEWETFELAMQRLREDRCTTLCFVSAQGESLLHPRIFDMLRASLAAGMQTNLVTNGTPLNNVRILWIADLGLHSIQFSFAGWDKASYETLYVGARFDQVTRNLRGVIQAVRSGRTSLVINGVVDDAEGAVRTAAFLQSLGAEASQIRVGPRHNWGGTVRAGTEQDGIWSNRDLSGTKRRRCPLLVSTPGIYVDGRVTACGCLDANGVLEIGHIKDGPISAMRAGDRYRGMVAAFDQGDVSGLPLCAKCEIPLQ